MKKDNKGFSLVELIIVIAIMAVLIAVLAPQFIKYVERSRNSTDKSNATAMVDAVSVWASETNIPDGETALGAGTGTITVTSSGLTTGGDLAAGLTSALKNAGITTTKCVSKTKWTQYVITVTISSDLNATFSCDKFSLDSESDT